MGRWSWVLFGITCIVASSPSARAAQGQDAVEVGTVLVSPRRIPRVSLDLSRFPGSATVVTADEIEASGATTAQEALGRLEGVMIHEQQGFGLGSDSTVNLRGIVNSSRTNVLVLLNGVRQNRITGDDVHWQSIPADQIERIEIIRGGGGLSYGEGALAGVINLITKQDSPELLETEHGIEVGSFGWQQYHVSARGSARPLRYGVNYTRRLVEGYRESSQSRNTTISAHGGVDLLPSLSADVNVLHSEDTTGFPGLLTQTQAEARKQQTNSFHGFNDNEIDQVSLDLIGGPWKGLSGVVNLYWRRWVQTSEDSINFNPFTITPSRGVSVRTNHEHRGDWLDHLLITGVELSEDKATTGDPGATPDSESNRSGYGLYVEETLTAADRVTLVGGLRFDKFRYEESLTFPAFNGTLRFEGWSPKVGLTLAAMPGVLDLFASYARPFKAPNVDDFSSRLGSAFSGNADLEPQQADDYEIGARLSRGPLTASATWFYIRIDDEILFNQLAGANQNFDTRRVGVELSSHLTWQERFRTFATYTGVEAEFRRGRFDDKRVPGTPRHTINTGFGLSPARGLWVDLQWRLVNDQIRINDMNNILGKADNYGVLDLLCQYDLPRPRRAAGWWPQTKAYLKILNLTNEEYVSNQSSNGTDLRGAGEAPMPPISFVGGLTVTF
jgi:iron complex outermembrane receptor protein